MNNSGACDQPGNAQFASVYVLRARLTPGNGACTWLYAENVQQLKALVVTGALDVDVYDCQNVRCLLVKYAPRGMGTDRTVTREMRTSECDSNLSLKVHVLFPFFNKYNYNIIEFYIYTTRNPILTRSTVLKPIGPIAPKWAPRLKGLRAIV